MSKAHMAVESTQMTLQHTTWAAASFAGASGVGLGAFGAHALKGHLSPSQAALWQTAGQYHLLHAVALMAFCVWLSVHAMQHSLLATLCVIAFAAGLVLFCGSLYGLALGAPRGVGIVTPIGGLLLILGWVLVGVVGWLESSGAQGL